MNAFVRDGVCLCVCVSVCVCVCVCVCLCANEYGECICVCVNIKSGPEFYSKSIDVENMPLYSELTGEACCVARTTLGKRISLLFFFDQTRELEKIRSR